MASPTPCPTPTTNKMQRRAKAPTTSTSLLHRPERNMELTTTSGCDRGDLDAELTPAKRAAEAAVDELSNVASFDDSDRLEAFESARKKFAMYGKQNAHVNHYSPDQQQAMLERKCQRGALKRRGGKGSSVKAKGKVPPPVRRAVEWDDDAETANAVVLKNTLLLQENGELAAHLDDIEYHLDGVLETNTSGSISVERGYAMAQSVVALTRLLQEDQVQAVLKVASHRRQIHARLRDVLLLLPTANHRVLTLAIAVMAYTLTHSADADEYFQEPVIDAIATCLGNDAERLGVPKQQPRKAISEGDGGTAEAKTPLKKSFLKRKKSTAPVHRASSAVREAVFGMDSDDDDGAKAGSSASQALRDEKIQKDLRGILRGYDAFSVDGAVHLSLGDSLGMVIHNILQIGSAATALSGGEMNERSFSKSTAPPRLHQRQDQAGTAFATILKRKQQLLRNHGLDVLLELLVNRVSRLQGDFEGDLLQASVSLDLVSAFQRVRTMLRVLDQASFLARDVQVHMSKGPMIFRVTLQLIEELSRVAWSRRSRRKWQSDPSFVHLVVDVLLASLRVLINLSHQNEDANQHLAQLEGTKVLFLAFCRLWGSTELDQGIKREKESRDAEDKVVYDAMLLILSAITNCVEYSEDNRALLSQIDLSNAAMEGLEAFKASSVCSLLASFFVSKVKSYVHLIEMSESQQDFDEEAWIPEDVILGGCTSLLLGCLMKDSSSNSAVILDALPGGSPRLLLRALSAFVALHSQIGALTPEVGKSVLEVEHVLKSFSLDDEETMPILDSPFASRRSGNGVEGDQIDSGHVGGRALFAANRQDVEEGSEATLTIKVTMTPVKRKMRRADVEEIEEDGDEIVDESQPSLASQQSVRSPPASAFKLPRFVRVCSNVGDSDDLDSDVEPSPVKKQRSVPTPKSQSGSIKTKVVASARASAKLVATARASAKVVASATPKVTPSRRRAVSETKRSKVDITEGKPSPQHRLKRTRQLVNDLEAEFMKIGSRASSEIDGAGVMTSTEDMGDGLDFSLDLSTPLPIPVKKKKRMKATTSSLASKKNKRAKSAVSPGATKGKQKGTPPTPQSRQTKATPSKRSIKEVPLEEKKTVTPSKKAKKVTPVKISKRAPPKSSTSESVFDFLG